jgi:uncharacterized protein (TIGR00369 family)
MRDIPSLKGTNPNFRELINEKLKGQQLMRTLGIKLTKVEENFVEAEAEVNELLSQQDGFVHGGVISTLADIVCGFASFTLVEPDQRVVTADLKIYFLNAGKGKIVGARGYVIKAGKTMMFCESDIYVRTGTEEHLIARGYSIMAVIKPQIK